MAYIRPYRGGFRAEVERAGKRTSATFDTKRQAQDWARRTELALLSDKSDTGKTFADATTKYLTDVSEGKLGHVWEKRRITAMQAHFSGPLVDIDAPDIAAWRDLRLKSVTASTVIREANLLRHIFRVARDEWRWIEHDPFRGVKMPAENQARHQVWRWQQIKRVLRADVGGKTAEVVAAFHIALRTGMRLGEVLLAPALFDAGRRVVVLPRTKTGGRAEVPIGRIAAKLLARPAFTVGANEASTLFAKMTSQLLIDDLTFHDARATALTLLAKKVDVMTLAKISRHKDLKILMNTYYRATADEIARKI